MLSLSGDLIWKRLLIVCSLSILTFFHISEALIFKWIKEYLGFISQVLLQRAVARDYVSTNEVYTETLSDGFQEILFCFPIFYFKPFPSSWLECGKWLVLKQPFWSMRWKTVTEGTQET